MEAKFVRRTRVKNENEGSLFRAELRAQTVLAPGAAYIPKSEDKEDPRAVARRLREQYPLDIEWD